MKTTCPRARSSIPGTTRWVSSNGAVRFPLTVKSILGVSFTQMTPWSRRRRYSATLDRSDSLLGAIDQGVDASRISQVGRNGLSPHSHRAKIPRDGCTRGPSKPVADSWCRQRLPAAREATFATPAASAPGTAAILASAASPHCRNDRDPAVSAPAMVGPIWPRLVRRRN
jgi:hypothetical protein